MTDNISVKRKKELDLPDPFQKNILIALAFARQFKKQIILIFSVILITVFVFSGIIITFKKAEETACQLVSEAMHKYTSETDAKKAFMEAERDFTFIFKEYNNTNAGRQGKIQFAQICYDAGKTEQSYQWYKEALNDFKGEPLLENFLLSSLAHVCVSMQNSDEAEKYFMKIEKAKLNLLKDDARFSLAMLNEAAGKIDESKKMYKIIVQEHDSSPYRPVAEEKIAVMN